MPRYFMGIAQRSSKTHVQLELFRGQLRREHVCLHLTLAVDGSRSDLNQVELQVDDVELFISALSSSYVSEIKDCKHIRVWMNSDSPSVAFETLTDFTSMVNRISQDLATHSRSQYLLEPLNYESIMDDLQNLAELSDSYSELLDQVDFQTRSGPGSFFRDYINFECDEDLACVFHFVDGTRKLVIPHLGSYQKINLPEDLKCWSNECTLGKCCSNVNDLNKLLLKMNWYCAKIAHKMKNHQRTDHHLGPYWVLN